LPRTPPGRTSGSQLDRSGRVGPTCTAKLNQQPLRIFFHTIKTAQRPKLIGQFGAGDRQYAEIAIIDVWVAASCVASPVHDLPRLTAGSRPLIERVAAIRASVHSKLLVGFLFGALLVAMAALSIVVLGHVAERVGEINMAQDRLYRLRQNAVSGDSPEPLSSCGAAAHHFQPRVPPQMVFEQSPKQRLILDDRTPCVCHDRANVDRCRFRLAPFVYMV
jgi:hypothetical protein